MTRVLSAAVAVLVLASPAAARADETCAPPSGSAPADERRARALYDDAVEREAADPEGALARYRCAEALLDRPAIALRRGAVAERLGLVPEAIVAFERYLALAGADAPDATEMRAHVARLRARAAEEARPDAEPAPPRAEAPRPAPPAQAISPAGVVLTAAGSLAVAAGVVLLVVAKRESDDARAVPPGTPWSSDDARGAYDAARRDQTIGIFALAGGAALAAVGVVLLAWPRTTVAAAPLGRGAALSFGGAF